MSNYSDHPNLVDAAASAEAELLIGRSSASCGETIEQRRRRTDNVFARFEKATRPVASDGDIAAAQRRMASANADMNRMLELLMHPGPPVKLKHWLKFEALTSDEAIPLLCGFCQNRGPEGAFIRLDGLRPYDTQLAGWFPVEVASEIRQQFECAHADRLALWNSRIRAQSKYPLAHYVEWAQSMDFDVEWLDWAGQHGYMPVRRDSIPATEILGGEKELAAKERNNYLLIISALAKKAGINPSAPSAAKAISDLIKLDSGANLSGPAIRGKLNLISAAIDSRS